MEEITNISARVLEELRERIISGELKPGYKLNEIDLSSQFGISRPPFREALRILEKDHMVVNIPRKGTYVSELSLKDFIEVSQAREMIECYCVDLLKAVGRRDLTNVEKALERAARLPYPFLKGDKDKLVKNINTMLEFHINLVEATENSLLTSIYTSIGYTLARYQYIYFHIDDSAKHSLDDHKMVLGLIKDGKFDQAKEQLRKHISYAVELVKTRVIHRAVF